MNREVTPNHLDKESLGRLMWQHAVPCIIPLPVGALYTPSATASARGARPGAGAFRICLSMMILACVYKSAFSYLQSLGRPWVSAFLSMVREGDDLEGALACLTPRDHVA